MLQKIRNLVVAQCFLMGIQLPDDEIDEIAEKIEEMLTRKKVNNSYLWKAIRTQIFKKYRIVKRFILISDSEDITNSQDAPTMSEEIDKVLQELLSSLTPLEQRVFYFTARGISFSEIAQLLSLDDCKLYRIRHSIFEKITALFRKHHIPVTRSCFPRVRKLKEKKRL